MISELAGNYLLKVKFGGDDVVLNPSALEEFTIVQDLDRLLPEFRMRLKDTTGDLTHTIPFDKGMSKVSVDLGKSLTEEGFNSFNFNVFRRFPESAFSATGYYEIDGLLDVKNLFSPDPCRAWNANIKNTLQSIAVDEFSVNLADVNISPSLEYKKLILQPRWSNAQLIKYLMANLVGSGGQSAFKCNVNTSSGRLRFMFRPLDELIQQKVKYKFIIADTKYQDYEPVFTWSIYDNYKILGEFAAKQQPYRYFDYETSAFTEVTVEAQDFVSLSDFMLIDGDDVGDGNMIIDNGTSNEFTQDFAGKVKSSYQNRLNNLVMMWIDTVGLEEAHPGDVVLVLFPQGISSGNLYSYQYSGYYLIKRVILTVGDTFRSRLLLTRHGLDTDKSTSLMRANKRVS